MLQIGLLQGQVFFTARIKKQLSAHIKFPLLPNDFNGIWLKDSASFIALTLLCCCCCSMRWQAFCRLGCPGGIPYETKLPSPIFPKYNSLRAVYCNTDDKKTSTYLKSWCLQRSVFLSLIIPSISLNSRTSATWLVCFSFTDRIYLHNSLLIMSTNLLCLFFLPSIALLKYCYFAL